MKLMYKASMYRDVYFTAVGALNESAEDSGMLEESFHVPFKVTYSGHVIFGEYGEGYSVPRYFYFTQPVLTELNELSARITRANAYIDKRSLRTLTSERGTNHERIHH